MISYVQQKWSAWSPAERRTSIGIGMFAVIALGFLLASPGTWTASGVAKSLAVVAYLGGSVLSPSFFLTKIQLRTIPSPPRPMQLGFLAFLVLFAVGSGIDLVRWILSSS